MEQIPYHHCLVFSEQISKKSFKLYTTTGRLEAGVSSSLANQRANLTARQELWARARVRVQARTSKNSPAVEPPVKHKGHIAVSSSLPAHRSLDF